MNYYKRNGNVYKLKKNKKKITYGDIENDCPWEKYQGENYVAKNCTLIDQPISKQIFFTDDLRHRIEIVKTRPKDIEKRIIYLFSIYDNNWKECRDWNPNNPNYHGQLYSFSMLEDQLTNQFDEMKELIAGLIHLGNGIKSDHVFPRRYNEKTYEAHFLSCYPIDPVLFQNYPIYFNRYFNLEFFYFTNRGVINKFNTDNYKKKNRINEFKLTLNPYELMRLINELETCYLTSEVIN